MENLLIRMRAASRLAMVVALETAAVAGLHRLGDTPGLGGVGAPRALDPNAWRWWLRMTPTEDVVVTVLRMIALALSWWLLISTAADLIARARGIPPVIRALCRAATPAPLRRLIDRAAAMGTAVSLLGAVAAATPMRPAGLIPEPVPPVRILDDQRALIVPPGGRYPGGRPIPVPSGRSSGAEAASLPPSGDVAASALQVVQPGDNLWKIAASRLRRETRDEGVTNARIHGYWTELIEANLSTLASRNPDLVRTGETIILPPIPTLGG